jgi:hypothetical protein
MAENKKETVVEELHKPARKNYQRRKVIVKGLNDLWQTDLVEMQPYAKFNKGYRYILVVINVFSKYVWTEPLKNKSGKDVTRAMKNILEQAHKPKNLQTDMGKEFYNKEFKQLMNEYNINHYSTFSNLKANIVERVNRTLKNSMWKHFSNQGNYKWYTLLPLITEKYNNTVHSTIGYKPKDVNEGNEKKILVNSFTFKKTIDLKHTKFKMNDYVRISKRREAFDKGYTPNWSTEIFQVRKVQTTNPTTYLLKDARNENIDGGFYEEELQKVKYPDIYLVEKVLRKKGNKVYVKWLGLDRSHNSWILKKDLM